MQSYESFEQQVAYHVSDRQKEAAQQRLIAQLPETPHPLVNLLSRLARAIRYIPMSGVFDEAWPCTCVGAECVASQSD